MKTLLTISVVLQFLAFVWAIGLARRERDWRFALLAVVLGIIAVRRLIILLTGSPLIVLWPGPISDFSGLVLGITTVAAIVGLDRALGERRRTAEQLRQYNQQLHDLTLRLNMVREEERAAISSEIQDEIGQVMAGLKIEIKLLDKELQSSHSHLLQRTAHMRYLTDRTMLAMRDIATELRPSVLDNLGLVAALEWQAETFQHRSGILCSLNADFDDKHLDGNLATAIFRIFQESLSNVLRHSEATEVEITLNRKDEKLLLTVQDNGKGISSEQVNKPCSLGILGMRERALPFAGELDVCNAPNGGAAVKLSIPLHHSASLAAPLAASLEGAMAD